jgi:hypothetical protein
MQLLGRTRERAEAGGDFQCLQGTQGQEMSAH